MKLLRVFPRKTKATPDDQDVRYDYPTLFDEADAVKVSVTWTWDKSKAEDLAEAWRVVTSNVDIGGPAYDDPGGEFEPGLFLRYGYVITSRGCPNHCWFCSIPRREGVIREIQIRDGWIVQDNNLLACSRTHIEGVFTMLTTMLTKQRKRPRFTGGLEAARLEDWHVEKLAELRPETIWLAYDTPDDWEPLIQAADKLKRVELIGRNHVSRCYVLVGFKGDTFEAAQKRLESVIGLGLMPMAMLFDHAQRHTHDRQQWIKFAREWANPWIVGIKMRDKLGY